MENWRIDFTDLAVHGGSDGRHDCQWGWYDTIRDIARGKTLLDVGTGLSKIKERLPEATITTHEACEKCPADIHGDLANVLSDSFHIVTCFDVVEHVVNYGFLVKDMARIAQKLVFITTPGYEAAGNRNPWHFHEFHPWEILQVCEAAGLAFKAAWGQKWAGPAEYTEGRPANLLTGVIELGRDDLLKVPFIHPLALLLEKGCSQ
jgi:hypothetical protein